MPEEPVTFDELEQLLLRLTGNSIEALEQQIQTRLKEQTLVGGKRVTRQELPELPQDAVTTVHRVKVSLYGAKPPVWRRLEIPGAMPLNLVHAVLQIAFDWHDYHLHAFETVCGQFGSPDHDDDWAERQDEATATLAQVAGAERAKVVYSYDFGDDWRHDIVVEKIIPAEPGVAYPRCTGGRRDGPPEDCGGIWVFNEQFADFGDLFNVGDLERERHPGQDLGHGLDPGPLSQAPVADSRASSVVRCPRDHLTGLETAGQSTDFQLATGHPAAPPAGSAALPAHPGGRGPGLHPAQWRLLRAAVDPGPDDLFIAADPHQRIYGNRVALTSLRISVRGRSRRLSLNYRTTQEILAWALPLLGADPVTGLDGEADSLLGYRSPMHGPRPQAWQAASRTEEFGLLAERVRSWLSAGLEPHAIGVTARSAALVREAREALEAAGIATASLSGRSHVPAVRTGTMHAMKGLEFQAVAVIGVEQGLVPEPGAVTPETEDPLAYAQDLQRERCVLFVACTRARDHLHVSGTGEPSPFLPPGAVEPVPPPAALHSR